MLAIQYMPGYINDRDAESVEGTWYEPNSKVLRTNCKVDSLATDNLVTALRWFDDEVLDDSSKKQIDLLLSQQFTDTRSSA